MLTSDKGFEDWKDILHDEVKAAAVLDRLLRRCHIVNTRGNGCRMRRHKDLSKAMHPTASRAVDTSIPIDGGPSRRHSCATVSRSSSSAVTSTANSQFGPASTSVKGSGTCPCLCWSGLSHSGHDRHIGTTGHDKGQACARGEFTRRGLLGAAEGRVARRDRPGACDDRYLDALQHLEFA